MLKNLKILTVITLIVFTTSVLTINAIDTKPSQSLNHYNQKFAAHKPSQEQASLRGFVTSVSALEDIKLLRVSVRKAKLQCFITSTCSNEDYSKSVINAGIVLKKHQDILDSFQSILTTTKAITIPENASLQDNYFLSFDLLMKLQLIEINHLFARANDSKKYSDMAVQKSLTLDSFLHRSLELPNTALTSVFLAVNLEWLRGSLQKHSPSKVTVKKLNAKEIIENMKLGEFILFSNSLKTAFKEKSNLHTSKMLNESFQTAFFSKNRTLNLYVKILDQSAVADCVESKADFCTIEQINYRHLVNPAGKMLVHLNHLSPSSFKKITNIAKKINALNL